MKTYTRYFLNKLAEIIGIEKQQMEFYIRKAELECSKMLPDDFDFIKLKAIICTEFSISEEEFDSSFRYGKLGLARQVLCYSMYYLGARNKQIVILTGFKPARISNSVKKVKKNNAILLLVEKVIKKYHAR